MEDSKAVGDSDLPATHVVHMLIPSHEGDHVLAEVEQKSNIARLPRVRIPTNGKTYYTWAEIETKVEEAFPYPLYFVKRNSSYQEPDVDNPAQEAVHDVWTVHPAGDFPCMRDPLKWIHKDELHTYVWPIAVQSFREDHVVKSIEYMFEETNWDGETRGKPWEASGFYNRLMTWTREILGKKGMIMEGRIRPVRRSVTSRVFTCTARMRGDQHVTNGTESSEAFFIKCMTPVTVEIEKTLAAASVLENIVPEVIGFDGGWGLLLQRDGGTVTEECLDQETIIRTILYMQRKSLKHIEELDVKGLRVMDAEWLEENIESILKHFMIEDFFWFQEESRTCCDKERETVKSLLSKLSELRKMCREITRLGLPRTIVHGDCYWDNIGSPITTEEGKLYRIFDWANAFIGSPLVDFDYNLPLKPKDAKRKMKRHAGLRQICEEWKQLSCLTDEELSKRIDSMGCLNRFFHLYELEEQYDYYAGIPADDEEGEIIEHKARIFSDVETVLANLGDIDACIKPARDRAIRE